MKIEQIIVQYLYQHKYLNLEKIGEFRMSPDASIPTEPEKEFMLPNDAIQFTYNPKTTADEALVDYIVAKTRKIKPLASSDLDSFINLNNQVINIGKALELEGIGSLQKNKAGTIDFTQARMVRLPADVAPVEIREKINRDISFSSSPKKAPKSYDDVTSAGTSNKKMWLVPLIALVLLGVGALGYFLYNKNKSASPTLPADTSTTNLPAQPKVDTAVVTNMPKPDTIVAAPPQKPGVNFKLVINSFTDLAKARASQTKLQTYGHKTLEIFTSDSITYLTVMPFSEPLADTTKIKDSIKKVFPKARLVY